MTEVADQETVQQVAAIEGMNKELADTQAERDAARAEVAELKRKYESDDGVLAEKIYQLRTDCHSGFLRVVVGTDKTLTLRLSRTLHSDNPRFQFAFGSWHREGGVWKTRERNPFFRGENGYGLRTVYVGVIDGFDYEEGDEIVVHFDESGLQLSTVNDDPEVASTLTIEEFQPRSTVKLSTKRAREEA